MAAAQPQKIRMIAGLGNPGEEYAQTRHNAGFKAIDELARQANVTYWKNQAGAEVASIKVNDAEAEGGKREVILVKPQSYMNTSGGPISKLCAQYKVSVEELLVIHDELDIPAGDVRIKVGGGHAGHNGLRSIIGSRRRGRSNRTHPRRDLSARPRERRRRQQRKALGNLHTRSSAQSSSSSFVILV